MKKLEFFNKINKIKEEIGGVIIKKSENPYFKSTYADLNTHLELIEPVLKKHNVLLTQPIIMQAGKNTVLSSLIDLDSGEEIHSEFIIPEMDDMQKLGGAVTYARRYTLCSLFALKAEDDDGETAVGRGGPKKTKEKSEKTVYTKPVDTKMNNDDEEIF
jgi:hypothetical protein